MGSALQFLCKHEKELDRLKSVGVDNMLLDFSVEVGEEFQKSEYLPPELLVVMARFSKCSRKLGPRATQAAIHSRA